MRCEVCNHEVNKNKSVPGLYFCSRCNCYGYTSPYGRNKEYVEFPVLLKTMLAINPLSEIFALSTVALMDDLCNSDQSFSSILSELIISDFPLKKLIQETESDGEIEKIIEQICRGFLFDSLACEYLVRAFAYALGKCNKYNDINVILDLKRKNGIIALFEVSRNYVHPGDNVLIRWKINSLRPSIRVDLDGKEIARSGLSEGVVSCIINSDCVITLTAMDRWSNDDAVEHIIVNTAKAPIIHEFKSNRTQIIEGDGIELSWDVENYERLILVPGNIDVSQNTSYKVFPKMSIEYVLIADNALGERTDARIIINVREVPKLSLPSSYSIKDIIIPSIKGISIPTLSDVKIPSIYNMVGDLEENRVFGKTSKIL